MTSMTRFGPAWSVLLGSMPLMLHRRRKVCPSKKKKLIQVEQKQGWRRSRILASRCGHTCRAAERRTMARLPGAQQRPATQAWQPAAAKGHARKDAQ